MLDTINRLLAAHGIGAAAPLKLADCTVTKRYLLDRAGIVDGTVFLIALPYYTTECDDPARNISVYAVSADYHRAFDALFAEILPLLRADFPENRFAGFADHSPISEVEAAVRAGLGFYGKNHLFLTEAHGSYVFLGEIVTDALLDVLPHAPRTCLDCGACARACPVSLDASRCLSALTQKKGDLDDGEKAAILAHGCAWGCDRCQQVCPIVKAARERGTLYTKISYFKETARPHLTARDVREMDEETFAARAYAWRGRAVILRNLTLLEEQEKEKTT